MMKNRVITISREFGSGGRTIGRQVADQLKIPCYDQELIEEISRKSGLSQEFIREKGEYALHGNWLINAFEYRTMEGTSMQDYLWSVQRNIILDLASEGPCVIVGRCADYILRDAADCLTVFIHADIKSRTRRIVDLYGETNEAPEKRLKDKDKRRAAYYKFYTGLEWGDAGHYHIALDSGSLGLDKCTEMIAGAY